MVSVTSLNPWTPSKSSPWNHVTAAHLLRRTGFSATITELELALLDDPNGAVDRLIDTTTNSERYIELDAIGSGIAARQNIESLRGWWLMKLQHTSLPLHARLSLMWHNHFATSNVKVASPPMMLRQLRTIEKHAAGSFHELLLAMSRDPAMIVWLDASDNLKGRPNENFARELFELFSLGVGNFTEMDIQEAARAFTGWSQKNGVYQFRKHEHDTGEKLVLHTRGNLNGDDVCRIASEHPACAKFIAHRLLREFVTPTPEDPLVQKFADELTRLDMHITESLRTLFKSQAFFHHSRYRARIKSPVEYVLGMVRSLALQPSAQMLSDATHQMSQTLFEPPSVKGWDGHKAWINSTTMLVRLNAAQKAAELAQDSEYYFTEAFNNSSVIHSFSDLLLDGQVPSTLAQRIESLDSSNGVQYEEAIQLLLTSPEYQLA